MKYKLEGFLLFASILGFILLLIGPYIHPILAMIASIFICSSLMAYLYFALQREREDTASESKFLWP